MKFKSFFTVTFLLCCVFLVSCTNTPWHRQQADIYLKKGISLLEGRQYLGALKDLLEAEKFAPNDAEIQYHLGIAYLGRGLRDVAMEKFQKAVSLKADYSEAHNYIGTLYMDMGQYEKAIQSYDKALANPLYATPEMALFNSGLAYDKMQNYQMALTKYREAMLQDRASNLKPQIEKHIGLVYIEQNNLLAAIEHIKTAVELEPSLYDAHFFLAESYLKIRDTQNAKKSFQQVIRLAPQSPFGIKSREYLQSIN